MNQFKTYFLDKTIAWLIGGDLFNGIKEIVAGLMDANMSGEEKRKKAYAAAKRLAGKTATFVVNLAIEAAVFILKQRAQKGK